MTAVSGILLAGGASRRFPPNKLLVEYEGEPLFWRPLRALAAACDEVVIVTAADRPLAPPRDLPARVTSDRRPGQGPLAALEAGLEAAGAPWALLAAGDMPDLAPALLRALAARVRVGDADALALSDGERIWPLPAALRVAAARQAAMELLDAGERRLRAIFERLRTETLDAGWWSRHDPEGRWRRDVDRPADLD